MNESKSGNQSTSNDNYEYFKKTIEAFSEGLNGDFQIVSSIQNNLSNRLIWIVAISGFSLINLQKISESISGKVASGANFVWLVLPWVITAFLGIVTVIILAEQYTKDSIYFIIKKHSIRAFLAAMSKSTTLDDILGILDVDNTDLDVKGKKKDVDNWKKWVDFGERATLFFFIILIYLVHYFPFLLFIRLIELSGYTRY